MISPNYGPFIYIHTAVNIDRLGVQPGLSGQTTAGVQPSGQFWDLLHGGHLIQAGLF